MGGRRSNRSRRESRVATVHDVGELLPLDAAMWPTIRRLGRPIRYEVGETLFHEGETGRSVYALASGQVKVTVVTPSGREVLLAVKGPDDLLGELAAIDGRPRSATATALEPVDTVVLEDAAFDAVLDEYPLLARRLLRVLAAQVREGDWRTADREGADTVTRVARRLAILAERYGEHRGDGGVRISLRLTQEDLASWIGATREATSRALGELRRAGAIETGRQRLFVRDLDILRSRTA
jgi:CRP-like cAMP-binding protein